MRAITNFGANFHVLGELSLYELRPHLLDSEYFVPEQIELPSLVPALLNGDDHLLHEFTEILPAEAVPYLCASEELIARVCQADTRGWFTGIF